MGHIRRRVKNYTILILSISEKEDRIDGAGAIRVRNGEEVAVLSLPSLSHVDPEQQMDRFARLQDFLTNDLVLFMNYSQAMPLMDKLYHSLAQTFFTNATMDVLPILEEAIPVSENPESFREKVEEVCREGPMVERARKVHVLYEKAAEKLFSYQEGYPYWVSSLPREEERYLAENLPAHRKTLRKALLAWAFGLHYFYLGHPKRNILYLLTLGGCFLWMFSDLFRMPLYVDLANEEIAEKVYERAPKIGSPPPPRENGAEKEKMVEK